MSNKKPAIAHLINYKKSEDGEVLVIDDRLLESLGQHYVYHQLSNLYSFETFIKKCKNGSFEPVSFRS